MRELKTKFTFAGFNFPRYIPEIHKKDKKGRTFTATYYHAPPPLVDGMSHPGQGFYLDDHGAPERRLWADEVESVRINHTGWFTDDQYDEKIRGLVVRLPHGKFLAGWSMGIGMCASVEGDIYDDIKEAAYAADSIAEDTAEKEREYQEEQRELEEQEERNQGDDAEEIEGY